MCKINCFEIGYLLWENTCAAHVFTESPQSSIYYFLPLKVFYPLLHGLFLMSSSACSMCRDLGQRTGHRCLSDRLSPTGAIIYQQLLHSGSSITRPSCMHACFMSCFIFCTCPRTYYPQWIHAGNGSDISGQCCFTVDFTTSGSVHLNIFLPPRCLSFGIRYVMWVSQLCQCIHRVYSLYFEEL